MLHRTYGLIMSALKCLHPVTKTQAFYSDFTIIVSIQVVFVKAS